MELQNLEIYKLARDISEKSWLIYKDLSFEDKNIFGKQFIRAVDSVGANIAEGFGRYHYLDKNKFNYNARGSLLESGHWLEIMRERATIKDVDFDILISLMEKLGKMLNSYIRATKDQNSNY